MIVRYALALNRGFEVCRLADLARMKPEGIALKDHSTKEQLVKLAMDVGLTVDDLLTRGSWRVRRYAGFQLSDISEWARG